MNTALFCQILDAQPEAALKFVLPDGSEVPSHFHVTEVGRVQKTFIDCGGTTRRTDTCLLQLWTAHDTDHRLQAGKLGMIMKIAQPILSGEDLPIEVEYGTSVAGTYLLERCDLMFGTLTLYLTPKQTDCLAKDRCGVGDAAGSCCT